MAEPSVSLLVPFRDDGGYRTEAWAWNQARWRAVFPEWEIVEASDDGGGGNPGAFSHTLAINRAAKVAEGDIFIMADADSTFDESGWLRRAVADIASGVTRWALPRYYHKVSQTDSKRILREDPAGSIMLGATDWTGDSQSVSGLVIMPRQAFELVGGYDTRYTHWGADDVCFALSLGTLWGAHTRYGGSCCHLWHPYPLEQTYGNPNHPAQHRLMERYLAAEGNEAAMRQLIGER